MKTQQTALITGATSGIGHELAKLFAQNGYNLVIVGRDQNTLGETAAELEKNNVSVTTIVADLFDQESAAHIYSTVQNKGLVINVLVNDAGQGVYGKFTENELRRELDIIQLNICSLVSLTKFFLKDMVKRGEGKILNLSSIASKSPGPWNAVYHGTKAFVQSFTEAIRYEVKDSGVTLTALLPGVTDTDFFNKANMQDAKIVQDESQMSDPADVAKDGFEALMASKDMIISGFKNKMQVGMNAVTPDETAAKKMAKQQEPVEKNK